MFIENVLPYLGIVENEKNNLITLVPVNGREDTKAGSSIRFRSDVAVMGTRYWL